MIKNYFGKDHCQHQEIDFFFDRFTYDMFLICQYPLNLDPDGVPARSPDLQLLHFLFAQIYTDLSFWELFFIEQSRK